MNDIMKIIKCLEKSGLFIKDIHETIKNEAREQKWYLSMLLGTLGASLLGDLLAGKTKLEQPKERWQRVEDEVQSELARTFNTASSFNKFWNTKVLSKWT